MQCLTDSFNFQLQYRTETTAGHLSHTHLLSATPFLEVSHCTFFSAVVPDEKNPSISSILYTPLLLACDSYSCDVELADAELAELSLLMLSLLMLSLMMLSLLMLSLMMLTITVIQIEICFGVGRFYSPITVLLLSFTFSLALFQHPSNANPPEAAHSR